MSNRDAVVPLDRVESLILSICGRRVILDSDLARLYGVTTVRLNEQVRRDSSCCLGDFMFQLSPDEAAVLRSQDATLERGRGKHRKYLPHVFRDAV